MELHRRVLKSATSCNQAGAGSSRYSRALITFLALSLVLLLAACGGQPDPSPTTGNLTVDITGLPVGISADVTVTGPDDFTDSLTATATLEDLEPGSYQVSAGEVTTASGVYTNSISGSPATVEVGKTAAAAVTYERYGAAMIDRHVVVPLEGSREVHLEVMRTGGYEGEVTVSIDAASLPVGVNLSETTFTVPAAATEATVTFTSDNSVTALNVPAVLPVTVTADGESFEAELTVEVGAIVLTTADDGPTSLRHLITNVPSGTLITFDPTVFAAPQSIALDTAITVGQNLSIEGPTNDAGEPYVAVNGGTERIFAVKDSVTVSISNLVLSDAGAPTSNGGAILNQGTLTLDNLLITNNEGQRGGAVYNAAIGVLTISNSSLIGNTSDEDGGALYNDGAATITSSLIEDNESAGRGGGLFNAAVEELTISDSQIIGNRAALHGGGVYHTLGGLLIIRTSTVSMNELPQDAGVRSGGGLNTYGKALVEDSTFSGNKARGGGGISMSHGGELQILRSTFSGNDVTGLGGGVFSNDQIEITNSTFSGNRAGSGAGLFISSNADSNARIAFSTFSDNTATAAGGGISNRRDLWLRGTIVAGNNLEVGATGGLDLDSTGSGSAQSGGYNLIGDTVGAGILLKPGDVSGEAPLLGSLGDNGGPTHTMALLDASPALGAVPALQCLDLLGGSLMFDQRREARPGAGSGLSHCDMGAYEAQ